MCVYIYALKPSNACKFLCGCVCQLWAPPFLSPFSTSFTTRALLWCVSPAWLTELALLEPSKVDPSVFMNKRTTLACSSIQTLLETDSLMCRHSHWAWRPQWDTHVITNLFLHLQCSNTYMQSYSKYFLERLHLPSTHGVHHFLSNSPFLIVNTHLCTIRSASSHLKHTHTAVPSLTHIQYV